MMTTLFISDLHLDHGKPHLTDIFLRFIQETASQAQALYLLGDIFEVWVGDDDDDPLMREVANALASLSARGVKVYFMHGNRDFMVAKRYAQMAGFELLEDPCVHVIGGVKTLLSHGDLYCTEDLKYQAFRAKSRTARWQRNMLRLPLFIRKALGRHARSRSKKYQNQLPTISDVTPLAIVAAMQHFGVKRMIHGHTHRPAVHPVSLKDGDGERIVLADWREHGEALEVTASGKYNRIILK